MILQLPQLFAWLEEAPEPLVLDIERWIVVVLAGISATGASVTTAARTVILIIEQIFQMHSARCSIFANHCRTFPANHATGHTKTPVTS